MQRDLCFDANAFTQRNHGFSPAKSRPFRPLVLILTEIELQCFELFLEKKFAKEMDSVGKGGVEVFDIHEKTNSSLHLWEAPVHVLVVGRVTECPVFRACQSWSLCLGGSQSSVGPTRGAGQRADCRALSGHSDSFCQGGPGLFAAEAPSESTPVTQTLPGD